MVLLVESKDINRLQNDPPNPFANPPPPYSHPLSPSSLSQGFFTAPPPFGDTPAPSSSRTRATLTSLPQHILLQIVGATCPSSAYISPAQHTRTLYWLTRALRLVNRGFYVASMHFLRSSYLPLYVANTKFPYSSDPFPATAAGEGSYGAATVLATTQRETAVLDQFLALKVLEDMKADASELHLDLDLFKDIFELSQPKARMEDLIRYYGLRRGVIALSPPSLSPRASSGASTPQVYFPIPFSQVSVNFSPRKVSLVVSRRTVVEVRRDRDETLESVAKRIVKELGRSLSAK